MSYTDGNGDGHVSILSPSEKAWQTAKDRAVAEAMQRQAENSARFHAQKQEMIRALTDPNLSHPAARVFCLLCHAGWEKEFGGLYKDKVGSIDIDTRRLARLCGGMSVNMLYAKNRKEKKTKAGKVLRRASMTVGVIQELVRGGYLWVSKKRIPNIQPCRWPNIYNISIHVHQQHTPHLPWLDEHFDSVYVQDGCLAKVNRNFDGSEGVGDGEMPQNTQKPAGPASGGPSACSPTGDGPAPRGPTGPVSRGPTARHPVAQRPVTPWPNGPSPRGPMARHPVAQRPSTARGDGPAPRGQQLREIIGQSPVDSPVVDPNLKRLSNRAKAKLPKRNDEEGFLNLARRVVGSDVEENSGLWITILRQDPTGAWAAMQDGSEVLRTPSLRGQVKTTMARYVMDKYLSLFAKPEFRRREYINGEGAAR